MDEINQALIRHEKRKKYSETEKENKNISKLFTKILLSIILLLSSIIYIKLSPDHLNFFKEHVFENNFAFTKINEWYKKTFGNILPSIPNQTEQTVFSETNPSRNSYLDGYQIEISKGSAIPNLASGLLVFMGEKTGYGNTFIIQGVDGVDIWYGSLQDTSLKLYDYVDAGTILGTASNDYYYLAFQKNGEFITYEEYFEQVSS